MTFLRYELELRCRRDSTVRTIGALTMQQAEMDARLRTVEQAVVRLGTIVDERLPAN